MSALRPNYREKKSGNADNALVNGLVDPTKMGKYPVLLSDSLLGRTQKDVFTAVKCTLRSLRPICSANTDTTATDNHKPQLSSDTAPALSRLKPSTSGSKTDFELSFQEDGGTYGYAGTRSTDSGQYVLYFDPEKKAFILDRVDSTFNMNLTRTPDNTDPDSLRRQYKHIDTTAAKRKPTAAATASSSSSSSARDSKPAASKPASKAVSKPASKPKSSTQSIGKAATTKKKAPERKAPVALALPSGIPAPSAPAPTKKDKRAAAGANDDDDEDEDDDDFGGLTVEYPDDPPSRGGGGGDFSPAFAANKITMRPFSEFLRDSEADDADGESDPEEDEGFKLPSPVGGAQQQLHGDDDEEMEDEQLYRDAGGQQDRMDVDSPGEADQDEMDLEADLEAALEAANSGDAGEESEVSEED